MGAQAIAVPIAMAMLQKMMQSKAAIAQEFQTGWEEAESGGMSMGENIRPGISSDKSVLPGLVKSYVSSYLETRGTGAQPLVSETLGSIGSSAVQGMAESGSAITAPGVGEARVPNMPQMDWMDQIIMNKLWEYISSFQTKGKK